MDYSKEALQQIFDYADRQRAIEQYIQACLYDHAREMKCYCTWLIEYPIYDKLVGFEFKLELTSEDKQHKAKKNFYVDYEWEKEKAIIKEIALYLLNQIRSKQAK